MPVDAALEDCRESESGYGPQRLSTLAAYSLRLGLLAWLQDAQVCSHSLFQRREAKIWAVYRLVLTLTLTICH